MFPIALPVLCMVVALTCAIVAIRTLPLARVRWPLYLCLTLSILFLFFCARDLFLREFAEKPLEDGIRELIIMSLILGLTVTYRLSLFSASRLQAKVDEGNQLLDRVYENTPIGVAFMDTDFRFVRINQRLADIHGSPVAAHIGRTIREMVPDLADGVEQTISAVIKTGEPSTRIPTCGVTEAEPSIIRHWLANYLPLKSNVGEILGVLVLVEEVTDAQREHDELVESRQQIRTILDSAAEAVITIDDRGIIQTFNRAAETMFGYASTDALGKNVTLLMPEPYHSEHDGYLKNYLKTGHAKIIGFEREVTGRRKNGATFPAELLVAEVGLESRRLFTGIVRDISERKKAEEKLRQSDVWLTDAQRIAHMGFWDWNVETNEVYWSDEIYSIFGLTPDLFGATYDAFIAAVHPDDRTMVKSAVDAAISEGAPYGIDHRTVLPNGEIRHVHEQGEVTRDTSGKATRMLGTVSDITDRKRGEEERIKLEAQLRQSQKMDAIGQLAGGVAHDFNNLLTVINGYSALVMEALGPDNPLREDVAEILDAGKRAGLLTSQLLAFSRKQVLQPTVLSVNAVVTEVEKMLRRLLGEDIELTTVLDSSAGMVEVDRGQLEQSIVNLAVNARDAMPGGGKLSIETRGTHFDENGRGKHPELEPGSYITLAVSDDGIGMDPKTKSHVFEPFFTTKGRGQGSGLGLSIVYGFAQQVGGHIDVSSEPGKGTTFTIYLPVVNKPAEKAAVPSSDISTYRGTETILLAEDEVQVRELAERVLTKAGYTILAAADGDEATKIAKAKNGPIDLLLTDVIMPGMSGRELADTVRPIRSDLKVLYISGYTDSAIGRHGVLDDGVAFLQKPFSPTDIVRKVREVLDAPH